MVERKRVPEDNLNVVQGDLRVHNTAYGSDFRDKAKTNASSLARVRRKPSKDFYETKDYEVGKDNNYNDRQPMYYNRPDPAEIDNDPHSYTPIDSRTSYTSRSRQSLPGFVSTSSANGGYDSHSNYSAHPPQEGHHSDYHTRSEYRPERYDNNYGSEQGKRRELVRFRPRRPNARPEKSYEYETRDPDYNKRISRDHRRRTPTTWSQEKKNEQNAPSYYQNENSPSSFRGLIGNLQGNTPTHRSEEKFGSPKILYRPNASEKQPAHICATPLRPGEKVERVLICWIGKIDLIASQRNDRVNPGPIRMLLERDHPYDRVILLAPHYQSARDNMREWLSGCISPDKLDIRRTTVREISDHSSVAQAIVEAVQSCIQDYKMPSDGTGITFHLSPGSPATHAVMVLIASVRFKGIRLMQTRIPLGAQSELAEVLIPAQVLKPIDNGNEEAACLEPASSQPIPAPAEPVVLPSVSESAPKTLHPTSEDGELSVEYEPAEISISLGNVYKKMERVAQMPLPILLIGESGSGKSRLAKRIHEWSGLSGRFVTIDCAGLTDEMLADELFGNGAHDHNVPNWRQKEGTLRLADGGTLLLENIDCLTPTQQTILLRTLPQAGESMVLLPAIGRRTLVTAHIRIIGSASMGIMEDLRTGKFRTDLYYRFAGVSAVLPAVREFTMDERKKLIEAFIASFERCLDTHRHFTPEAWNLLLQEEWPGNLREMSRLLQQICLLSDEDHDISAEEVEQQLQQGRIV